MNRTLAALAILLLPGSAVADDVGYRSFPLGGRAVGLGGAFTALGDDPSGLFYNPAGLVDVTKGSVHVGGNLYGITVQGGLTEAFGTVVDVERVASQLDIVPAAAAGISVLERDESGRPVTVYSLGSFAPSVSTAQSSAITELSAAERFSGCARLAYERTSSDRRFLFGGGIGHRLSERWSVGLSGFLAYRTLRAREEIACSDGGEGLDGPAFSTADTRLDVDVFSLLLQFAVKLRLDEGWRLGAVLATPSIRAYGRSGVRVRRTEVRAVTGQTQFFLEEKDNLRADTREALSLRVGAAKVWEGVATISADLSMYAPVRYRLVDIDPAEAELLEAITLTTQIERRPVANIAIGGEYLLRPELSVALGVFTNFASSPPIPGPTGAGFDRDRLPHVHEVGGTLVGGIITENTITRIGLLLAHGAGSEVVPRSAGLDAVGGRSGYVKADRQQTSVFFYLSNTTQF